MTERWLPVVGYEGFYEVSDRGRVQGLRHNQGLRQVKLIRRLTPDRDGYWVVSLSRPGRKRKLAKAHRLVLLAFVGPPPTSRHITHHKNNDRADAHLENLEWVEPSDNDRYAYYHGNRQLPDNRGENQWKARLTADRVREIRCRYAAGETPRALGLAYGVHLETIRNVVTGRTWRHVK